MKGERGPDGVVLTMTRHEAVLLTAALEHAAADYHANPIVGPGDPTLAIINRINEWIRTIEKVT